ncbi:hypothetical protein GQ53DRAFT_744666 [Thozetella sp. PMI_491]|nr:hypothetical protein GQ53DRAFT_744666 [Thozetella sp. PMI_491]
MTHAFGSCKAEPPPISSDNASHTSLEHADDNPTAITKGGKACRGDTCDRHTKSSPDPGLYILFDSCCAGEPHTEPEIDVVAVHGLNFMGTPDHAWKTWTKGDKLWLRDFLPARLLRPARVMLFAYNSSPAIGAAATKLDDHAKNLLHRLWLKRKASCVASTKDLLLTRRRARNDGH